ALGVRRVVGQADRGQLRDGGVDGLGVEAAPAEEDAQLVLGAVAARGRPVAELDRAPLLGRIAQAALRSSSGSPSASMITPSSSTATGATATGAPDWAMPTAS